MIFSLFLFDAVKNFISLFRCKTKIATRHEFGRPCSLPPTRKTKQNTSVKWVSQRPNWLRYRGRARCCVSPTTTTIAVTRNRWRERRLPRTYAAGDLYGDGRLGLSSAKFERERERETPWASEFHPSCTGARLQLCDPISMDHLAQSVSRDGPSRFG